MNARKEVLKPFEEKRSYMEDRIQSGIEANRKGWARLAFVDKEGKPVQGVHVAARQTSHDFKYGANLFMLDEFDSTEQNAAYKELFADAFNIATLPFYWDALEPQPGKTRFAKDSEKIYRRPAPDLCLEYCEQHAIEPKAHCLNYMNFSPKWVPRTVRAEKFLLEKRFRELAERYSDRIPSWEVTNETFWGPGAHQTPFYQEPDFVEWSFETAARYFHSNKLLINEACPLVWGDPFFHFTRSPYYLQIERALAKGAHIDSIGMQYHMFYHRDHECARTAGTYDPERLYQVMDTYARFGLPIQITELTIPAYAYTEDDEDLQAEIIRNLYSMWFSHSAMEAIIYWNVIDGFAAFAPQGDMTSGENYYHGGLVRYDFTPKKSYHLIQELFGRTWRTRLDVDSHGSDSVSFKGFYGMYDLEITANGQTKTIPFHLGKNPFQTSIITL